MSDMYLTPRERKMGEMIRALWAKKTMVHTAAELVSKAMGNCTIPGVISLMYRKLDSERTARR